MKNILKLLTISILITILLYVCNIDNIPSNVVLFEGEDFEFSRLLGLKAEIEKLETVETSSNIKGDDSKTAKISVKLGNINVKNIDVNIMPKEVVIPSGKSIGLKLYTNGVLVVGMSDIDGEKPYKDSGIEEGDRIIKINEKLIDSTNDLVNEVNKSKGETLNIEYVRNGKSIMTSITPTETANQEYKIGLWVRDAAAGVGTLTFIEPKTNMFAALGHGIVDIDTGEIVEIGNGELVTSDIVSIKKGESGSPGEIRGSIENCKTIGKVYQNSEFGIYGKIENMNFFDNSKTVEILGRKEVKEGKATILCTLENNATKEYEIEIEKIYTKNNYDNKSMMIKITDEELINKTGGIIQGMSGSPILQDGKFVGAVTHVLVNDPQKGYAVFADMMLRQMNQ